MKPRELQTMAPFFDRVRDLSTYLASTRERVTQLGTCDCEIGTAGLFVQRGRCITESGGPVRDATDCLTVAHLAARIQLDQLKLPVTHLSDPQLDTAVEQLHQLVDHAPDITQRRFVLQLQTVLRAGLLHLAQPQPTDTAEETPAP